MDYSELKLEREGQRLEDYYILSYSPKGSMCGVQERLAPWLAQIIKAIMLEKCPENVIEHEYGYRQEKEKPMFEPEPDEYER